MRFLLALVLSIGVALPAQAAKPKPKPVDAPPPVVRADEPEIAVDLDRVRVSELASAVYSYAINEPYVLSPEVTTDDRAVALRIVARPSDFRAQFVRYMSSLGYTVRRIDGADHVARTPVPQEPPPPPVETFVYRPQFRDASYLSDLLRPVFEGGFTANRKVPAADGVPVGRGKPGTAAAMVDQAGADTLVFVGTAAEVRRLRELLPQVDQKPGQVYVQARVYEVNTTDQKGSAFSLAVELLGARVGFGTGSNKRLGDGASYFSVSSGGLGAVVQILDQDQRFHVVDEPSSRVMSGRRTRLTAGGKTPVLTGIGAAYETGDVRSAVPLQSIDYRDSGIILDVAPIVRGNVVELALKQEISNFVPTTTGVNNTPTLIQRAIDSSLMVNDGETVILGGLVEQKETESDDGPSFMPDFMRSRVKSKSKVEILLVLYVSIIK